MVENNESLLNNEPILDNKNDIEKNSDNKINNIKKEEVNQYDECCKLTYKQRIFGFILCTLLGFFISIGSYARFRDAIKGDSIPFALYFTFGNISAICGSFFLSGPQNQLKSMFEEKRIIASIVYILSIILILIIVNINNLSGKSVILILLIFFQYISWFWYTISYIPYARDIVKKIIIV